MTNRDARPPLAPKHNPRLYRSFAYALAGIGAAVLRERNLRIHLAVGAGALYFARYYGLSRGEWALLILTVGFVVVCELFNTAVEHLTDLAARQHIHPLARAAKDIAAGAVLVSALCSAAVGVLLFWEPAVLEAIWRDALARPLPRLAALAAACAWVWLPGRLQRREK